MKEFFDQPKRDSKNIEHTTDYMFGDEVPSSQNAERSFLDSKDKAPIDIEAEKFFSPINPENLLLADVKKNLEKSIEEKSESAKAILESDYYSDTEKNATITATKFQIKDLEKWIGYLDYYLSSNNPDVIKELKLKIKNDKQLIEDATQDQKSKLN